MRVSGLWCVAAWVACLLPIAASAQNTAQRRAAAVTASEEQTEPYHKHRDIRHGHDHYYPDRGAIVRDLPVGTIGTSYAGVSYRYHDGIWLEPRGPAYMVVAPPIGLVAPTLPLYSTVVTRGPESYLYCNDAYYRPRPDLGGYEVVNDPAMEAAAAPAAPDALVGGQMPGAPAAAPAAQPAVPALPAAMAGTTAAGVGIAAGSAGAGTAGVGMAPTPGAVVPASSPGALGSGAVVPGYSAGALGSGAVVPVGAHEASLNGGAMPGVGAAAASVP